MGFFYILLGCAFGAIITYLRMQNNASASPETVLQLKETDRSLETMIKSGEAERERFEAELKSIKAAFDQKNHEIQKLDAELSSLKSMLIAPSSPSEDDTKDEPTPQPITPIIYRNDEIERLENEVRGLEKQVKALAREKAELEKEKADLEEAFLHSSIKVEQLEKDLKKSNARCEDMKQALLKEQEDHETSKQLLLMHRTSFEALGKKFNSDFEHMATKILEELESTQTSK